MKAQEDATFSTDVKVVNVLTTVRTKKGEIVRDLTKGDFSISENGQPQNIRYFARQSDLPLTIGLMVDTSMSQQRVLDAERGASFHFVDQVLREKDKVFVMQFDMRVLLRQGLTSSRREVEEALAYVDTPTINQLKGQEGGGTLLYDAVETASKEYMKNQSGRKALIVLSDGVDTGSDATLQVAIDSALRVDTMVYSILFSDEGYYGGLPGLSLGAPDGKGILMRLSKETGGGFFEVSKKQSIERIFGLIEDELPGLCLGSASHHL